MVLITFVCPFYFIEATGILSMRQISYFTGIRKIETVLID